MVLLPNCPRQAVRECGLWLGSQSHHLYKVAGGCAYDNTGAALVRVYKLIWRSISHQVAIHIRLWVLEHVKGIQCEEDQCILSEGICDEQVEKHTATPQSLDWKAESSRFTDLFIWSPSEGIGHGCAHKGASSRLQAIRMPVPERLLAMITHEYNLLG